MLESTQEAFSLSQSLQFQHRHKTFELKLTDDGAIELYLDNCLRKRRDASEREPQYVWTNVELSGKSTTTLKRGIGRLRVSSRSPSMVIR